MTETEKGYTMSAKQGPTGDLKRMTAMEEMLATFDVTIGNFQELNKRIEQMKMKLTSIHDRMRAPIDPGPDREKLPCPIDPQADTIMAKLARVNHNLDNECLDAKFQMDKIYQLLSSLSEVI